MRLKLLCGAMTTWNFTVTIQNFGGNIYAKISLYGIKDT